MDWRCLEMPALHKMLCRAQSRTLLKAGRVILWQLALHSLPQERHLSGLIVHSIHMALLLILMQLMAVLLSLHLSSILLLHHECNMWRQGLPLRCVVHYATFSTTSCFQHQLQRCCEHGTLPSRTCLARAGPRGRRHVSYVRILVRILHNEALLCKKETCNATP